MLLSLGRNGQVVQSGEGSFNIPMGVDEVDNTLSHPTSQAEALAYRERCEYATMAALSEANSQQQAQEAKRQAYLQSLATEYEEWSSEEQAEANGGENPLLYLAAMQSMAGGMTENYTPLGGYLLSQDGQIDYPRGMSGRIQSSMGQDVQSLIQSAQSAAQQGQALVQAVTGSGSQAAPAAASQVAMPAGLASLMQQKVGGIPVPYLAAGVLAFLFLRK